ncbi:hypothetical protein RZS08_15260, partial [Arthrospira platensis SPKY1]|nr:hypothetical protein [Arthrospira platensis SPKY1]
PEAQVGMGGGQGQPRRAQAQARQADADAQPQVAAAGVEPAHGLAACADVGASLRTRELPGRILGCDAQPLQQLAQDERRQAACVAWVAVEPGRQPQALEYRQQEQQPASAGRGVDGVCVAGCTRAAGRGARLLRAWAGGRGIGVRAAGSVSGGCALASVWSRVSPVGHGATRA